MNSGFALLLAMLPLLFEPASAAVSAGPIVAELFTSQGCSSCPPADALLGELGRRPDVLALALHVTYWNDLGWADPFSQARFDQRQRDYARQATRGQVYTPQLVINGARDVIGSSREGAERALAEARRPARIEVRQQAGQVALTLPALDHRCGCVLTLFALRASASTAVSRGENAGRALQEYFVVRAMQSLGAWDGSARTLQLDRPRFPDDVTDLAVVAQQAASGEVLAAGR